MIGLSGDMTSSERMTCLIDRDICNGLIKWTHVVMVSVLASCWQPPVQYGLLPGMASSPACRCGAEEQAIDHVVLQYPIHRPPPY